MSGQAERSAAQDRDEWLPWSARFALWRMNWFPYRTYEYFGPGMNFGPARWQWPDVLRRPHRG